MNIDGSTSRRPSLAPLPLSGKRRRGVQKVGGRARGMLVFLHLVRYHRSKTLVITTGPHMALGTSGTYFVESTIANIATRDPCVPGTNEFMLVLVHTSQF